MRQGQVFTARNGEPVKQGEDGAIHIGKAAGYLSQEAAFAAEEFFQAKRDEELGRWRWLENPDYVVYADEDGDVVVLNEGKGVSSSLILRRDMGARNPDHPATEAARAYFEAHPVRKPWEEAKAGEVWLVTRHGREAAYTADSHDFNGADEGGDYFTFWHADADITAARRIWPEAGE